MNIATLTVKEYQKGSLENKTIIFERILIEDIEAELLKKYPNKSISPHINISIKASDIQLAAISNEEIEVFDKFNIDTNIVNDNYITRIINKTKQ